MTSEVQFGRLPAVKARTGIKGTSTIYAAMARGEFPRPRRTGRNMVAWNMAEIDEWLKSREVATYREAA